MQTYNTMEMNFEYGEQPDLGSIVMTKVECVGIKQCRREYLLNSADKDKLQQITNAADGSTAYCTDTGDLYLLHLGVWAKVGAGSE
ncbi:MAG: hypothetical protein ACI4IN_06910 [Eubacterium sp.]